MLTVHRTFQRCTSSCVQGTTLSSNNLQEIARLQETLQET